jgi:hypothetical protein
MRLPQPFVKLPFTFDHEKLVDEISQFGAEEWRAHPQRLQGNSSLILVSTNGGDNDDFTGPMKPTYRLEKTPKNALRIPFLVEAFPDARFIFLFRNAKQNISSLLDSWRSGRYMTYPRLPRWPADRPWSHLLIPGWQDLAGRPLAEVVARP